MLINFGSSYSPTQITEGDTVGRRTQFQLGSADWTQLDTKLAMTSKTGVGQFDWSYSMEVIYFFDCFKLKFICHILQNATLTYI